MDRNPNEAFDEFERRRQDAGDFILTVVKQRDDRQNDAAARLLASMSDESAAARFNLNNGGK